MSSGEPIELPIPPRAALPPMAEGTGDQPGRNHPAIGRWLIDTFRPAGDRRLMAVVDPMCGAGQLWATRPDGVDVFGCDLDAGRVAIAVANGISAVQAMAEEWEPPVVPDLIAFSPIYPNCDHDSGHTQRQKAMVAHKRATAMQAIRGSTNLLPVFLQIARYRDRAPVAVITRNYIDGQAEVDWTSEVAASMVMAGLGEVRRYFRRIPPGMTESWKVARGTLSPRTGRVHRVVDREWVLVAMGGAR